MIGIDMVERALEWIGEILNRVPLPLAHLAVVDAGLNHVLRDEYASLEGGVIEALKLVG